MKLLMTPTNYLARLAHQGLQGLHGCGYAGDITVLAVCTFRDGIVGVLSADICSETFRMTTCSEVIASAAIIP